MENLNDLEKVDLIRQRLGVSYREAKEALDQSQGDVVKALVFIEERKRYEKMHPPGEENQVWGQIKTLVHKGNVTKIQLKRGDRTLLQVPATVGALGVVGAVAFPALAVVGAAGLVTALASKCSIEIDRQENLVDDTGQGDND